MSSNNRTPNIPNIPWWMVIAGFAFMSPVGIILLVLKIIRESSPKPERWGQTGSIPSQRVRSVTPQNRPVGEKTAGGWRKPKYPMVPLNEGKGIFIAGLVIAIIFGIGAVDVFADWGFGYLRYAISDAIAPLTFSLCGVGAMIWGRFKTNRTRKFKRYLARIGNGPLVPLRPLAESIPASMDEVFETFQQMIDKGVFGDHAYLDISTETLVLDGTAAKPEAKPKPAPKQEKASSDEEVLRQIRRANDLIPGEEISRKIDRIEEITRHILNYLKKHPERSSELHTFLDYYLPTTLKMLNTYAELDAQKVGTENIAATKQRIEGILDKVVEGFETQLDKLFEGDMLDITSDIDVMEKMLSRDGLANEMKIPKAAEPADSAKSGYTPTLTLEPEQSGTAVQDRPW